MTNGTYQNIGNYTIELGKDINTTKLISTDSTGTISKLSFNNDKEIVHIDSFSSNHYFSYYDLNNDKISEYIFLDQSILSVFDHDKRLLFNHVFDTEISNAPILFHYPNNEIRIGVLADKSEEIYLFDIHGNISEGFPLYGSKLFSIGDINKNKNLNLITGDGNKNIYTYSLE